MRQILSSIQWAIFILAGSIVAPVAVGAAFHLSVNEIAGLLQRSFFVIGLGSLLQVFWGHRLPIAEGPAGLWWGVFLVFASFGTTMNIENKEILQSLEMGLLISGGLFIVMSILRLIHVIKQIFTPMVTGTYLFLLISQLSGSFVRGVLGIGYITPRVNIKVAVAAFAVLIITAVLAKSRFPMIRSFSILYGMIIGWILFAVLGIVKSSPIETNTWFSVPHIFEWGSPKFHSSIVLTAVITALLLLSNLIASIEVVKKLTSPDEPVYYNRSGFVMGINQLLAGIFSTTGFVPVSTSAGFIATTNAKEKIPFIIGSSLILLVGLFPPITLFFASLPTPVGYATIFLTFSNMIVMALKEFFTIIHDDSKLKILGISLMVGIGSMFVPTEALKNIPSALVSLLNNGLILGVITCILLEQGLLMKKQQKGVHEGIWKNL